MIYDKTDEFHWSESVENWDRFDRGDVVVGLDPQERLGGGTYLVSQIYPSDGESVVQRGLFWIREQAMWYAEALDGGDQVRGGSKDQYILKSEVVMDSRPVEIPPGSREVEVEYQKTVDDGGDTLRGVVNFLEPVE